MTPEPIPLLDVVAQHRAVREEVLAAVERVMDSGSYIMGAEVERFENLFSDYCGVRHAIAVNTGTSALHLALLALDIGPGDEVVTTPFTFVATVSAICYTGARPVLVDIDDRTLTLDPERFEAAVTPRTKAVIPVHIHGHPADMDPILEVAGRHGIAVVEDAAQAHGSEYRNRRVGALGSMGCFSFYPGKNLGTYGEGGGLTTDDDELARKIRLLRDWGAPRKYHHVVKGYNYRLDEIHGACLAVKMKYIEAWTEARRERAAAYDAALAGSGIRTPEPAGWARHVYHVYATRVAHRDRVVEDMKAKGVHCGIHYPTPVHLQPAFADLGYGAGDFPVAERVAREELSLPIFPELTGDQILRVASALRSCHEVGVNHDG